MKKIVSLVLSLLMGFSLLSLAGCGAKKNLKLGLGISTSIGEIKNATEEVNGTADVSTAVAAVLLDEEGKIVKCAIDSTNNEMYFSISGEALALENLKSKRELGDDYGMVKYQASKKEWYEQVDAFISVITGKTIDEVKKMQDGDKGNEEITNAGCTIKISEFMTALEKACNNAKESAAGAEDTLKLALVSKQDEKTAATEEAKGATGIMTTAVALALDSDNKVTASINDAVAAKVEFDTKGVSTTEFGKAISTKRELGDDYGMVKYKASKTEWYEQADAFDTQLIGKTATEIYTLADSSGKPGDDLVTAGCTINVSDMISAAAKAAK